MLLLFDRKKINNASSSAGSNCRATTTTTRGVPKTAKLLLLCSCVNVIVCGREEERHC